MEVPDVLVVTKADLGAVARRAEHDLRAALGALGAPDTPVLAVVRRSRRPGHRRARRRARRPPGGARPRGRTARGPAGSARWPTSSPSTASAACARSAAAAPPGAGCANSRSRARRARAPARARGARRPPPSGRRASSTQRLSVTVFEALVLPSAPWTVTFSVAFVFLRGRLNFSVSFALPAFSSVLLAGRELLAARPSGSPRPCRRRRRGRSR